MTLLTGCLLPVEVVSLNGCDNILYQERWEHVIKYILNHLVIYDSRMLLLYNATYLVAPIIQVRFNLLQYGPLFCSSEDIFFTICFQKGEYFKCNLEAGIFKRQNAIYLGVGSTKNISTNIFMEGSHDRVYFAYICTASCSLKKVSTSTPKTQIYVGTRNLRFP